METSAIQKRKIELFKFINIARQYPSYYASLVDQQLSMFINNNQLQIHDDAVWQTDQGITAWKEAKQFLNKQKPLPPLKMSNVLEKAAIEHSRNLKLMGEISHIGVDGSTFEQRIKKYCNQLDGSVIEIIGKDFLFGGRNSSQKTVLALLIDDGVHSRGDRRAIYNQNFHYVGLCPLQKQDKLITVFTLSEMHLRGINKEQKQQKKISTYLKNSSQMDDINDSKSSITRLIEGQTNSSLAEAQRQNPAGNNFQNSNGFHLNNDSKQLENQYNSIDLVDFASIVAEQSNKTNKVPSKKLNVKKGHNLTAELESQQNAERTSSEYPGSQVRNLNVEGLKGVREKKETTRNWIEGDYHYEEKLIRTTYKNGKVEELIERRAVLQNLP